MNDARARQRPGAGGVHENPPPACSRTMWWKCQPASVSKRSISTSTTPPSGGGEIAIVNVTADPGETCVDDAAIVVFVTSRTTSVSRYEPPGAPGDARIA